MIARDTLATLQLSDGRLWIDAADPFQLADALAVLEGDAPYNFLTRARGASKTTDLAAVALSMLLAGTHPARLYWLAADAEQGGLAVDAIHGFASRTPALASQLDVQARRVAVPTTNARLDVLPADAPSAWGLNPDAVFVDELANWHDGPAARRLWEAASSAVAKRPDARLAVLTTAGSPDHFARKVLDHALTSPLWRVNEVPGPAPWADPDRIAEQQQRLPDAVFRQLFRNEWIAAAGSFLDPAVIDAAFTLDGPAMERAEGTGSHVAALDLGSVNDRTAFAIGHREGETVRLDRMMTWQGSRARPVDFAEVESFIVESHGRFGFKLRLDPWQGLDLAQRLRTKGIAAEEFTFSQGSKQRLAASLLHSLNAGHLKLYEAEGLREELMGLRLKQSASGAWSFDHGRGGHDDRAVAVALMTVAALEKPMGSSGPPIFTTAPSRWREPGTFSSRRGRSSVPRLQPWDGLTHNQRT